MRLRYFIITTFVMTIVSLFSLLAHNYLATKDQANNTDALLKQTAATVMNVDWANPERTDLQRVESILTDEMGENDINRFFILREKNGTIIYKSRMVSILQLEGVPLTPKWVFFLKDNLQIRVFNLNHKQFPDRTLQVGLITSTDSTGQFSRFAMTVLFLSIGALGILSSWLLASVMFYPIRKVGQFLSTATKALEKKGLLPTVPKELFSYLGKKDELRRLTEDLDSLLNKINTNYRTSRLWAAQMAHELKTPLSQLLLHLESTSQEHDPVFKKSQLYIETIKTTINSFLDWAELENSLLHSKNQKNISVISCIRSIISLNEVKNKNRIELIALNDFSVCCDTNHLQQLIQNLTSNALKYSEGPIEIKVVNTEISIKDSGGGISNDVMEKLGDPFNFGNSNMQKKGHGLGLAWVKTICQRYNWDLKVSTSQQGTVVALHFPANGNGNVDAQDLE